MPADPQPVRVRAAQHSNGGGVGEGTRPDADRVVSGGSDVGAAVLRFGVAPAPLTSWEVHVARIPSSRRRSRSQISRSSA
jgi:hypothetical protein